MSGCTCVQPDPYVDIVNKYYSATTDITVSTSTESATILSTAKESTRTVSTAVESVVVSVPEH